MAGKKQQSLNDKLIMAAKNGHFIDAKKWLRKGAQVDKPVEDLFGMTPIIIALGADPWNKGHYDIVNFLLKNGANPNQKYPFDEKTMGDVPDTHREMSLLSMEVYHGRLGIMQLLVKHGSDVNQRTEGNIGPLDIAIESETHIQSMDLRVQIVKFLLENHVFTEYKDKTRKLSPFHRSVEEGHFEVVKLLIEHGVDIESHNEFDNTPIITAAHKGHLDIVKLLLEQEGIDINGKGAKDYSMLHFAVEDFNVEMVEYLLAKGANVNALTGKNNTPLHSACNDSDHHLNRNKVTEILLKYGADISARNIAGATPLHSASEYGLNLAVELFLKKGT